MRSGPGTDFGIIGTVSGGTALNVRPSDVPGWVEVSDGTTTGYMAEKLLSDDANASAKATAKAAPKPKKDKSRPKAVKVRTNAKKPKGYKAQAGHAVARKKSFDETRVATRQATDTRLTSVRQGLML